MNFENLQLLEGKFDGQLAYKNSKLANLLFAKELARRLEGTGVTVNSICPGNHGVCLELFKTKITHSSGCWVFLECGWTDQVKILWDLSIQTDHVIEEKCLDVVVLGCV